MLIGYQPTSRPDGLSSDGDVPDFAGLDSFAAVLLQVHVADLPHAPRLGHPHVLVAVALARHHLVHLTDDTAAGSWRLRPPPHPRGRFCTQLPTKPPTLLTRFLSEREIVPLRPSQSASEPVPDWLVTLRGAALQAGSAAAAAAAAAAAPPAALRGTGQRHLRQTVPPRKGAAAAAAAAAGVRQPVSQIGRAHV